MLKITEPEYALMTRYIEAHCGIHLEKDKEYLIESRLSGLLAETGCRSFQEFHFKARTDPTGRLRDRIIDAMTTNETSWFRDKDVWEYIETTAVPRLLDRAERSGDVRIWSAAAATGQEVYSLMMLLDEAIRRRKKPAFPEGIDILASDISATALETAAAGRYDAIAINRGLPEAKRQKYFTREGPSWHFDEGLRKRVRFEKFNLQDPFRFPHRFDLILCRYVSIYFSESFKRAMFAKLAGVLREGGVLLLGATESLRDFSTDFDITYYKNAVINTKKFRGPTPPGNAKETG